MAILRSLFVVVPLSGLVASACSGSSEVSGSGGAGGATGGSTSGGAGGGSATGGSGGATGGTGSAGKGAGGSGSAGKGAAGSGPSTGGRAGGGSAEAGEGGAAPSTGGSAGTAGTAGTGGIPLAQAPVELANAVCPKALECCSEAELMLLNVATEDQCRLLVAGILGLYQADIQASITAMRAGYDGEALSDCIAAHEVRECDMFPSFGEIGCPGAVIPLIPLGESCGAHHECIDGYCDGATTVSSPTGTCAAKKGDGEPCVDPEECEGGGCSSADGCGPTSDTPICSGA